MTLSIVLLHLVCQDSGERSDFLQDLIQFGIGVVCRVPLAQLAQVNVEVVARGIINTITDGSASARIYRCSISPGE